MNDGTSRYSPNRERLRNIAALCVGCLPRPEVQHVHIRSRPRVVCQIPARVVRVFVDHDGIVVPLPIADVVIVVWRYAEKPVVEPKPVAAAASQMIDMPAPESAGKVTVLPNMVNVVMRVIAPAVMADPSIVAVDVRRLRMLRAVAVRAPLLLPMIFFRPTLLRVRLWRAIFLSPILGAAPRSAVRGRRTVGWNVAATDIARASALFVRGRRLVLSLL